MQPAKQPFLFEVAVPRAFRPEAASFSPVLSYKWYFTPFTVVYGDSPVRELQPLNRFPTFVICFMLSKKSTGKDVREVQPLNILPTLVTAVIAANSSDETPLSCVQPWNIPFNVVTAAIPSNRPSGISVSEVQPLNTLERVFIAVIPLNRPAGTETSEVQFWNMPDTDVTPSTSQNRSSGTVVMDEHPLNIFVRPVGLRPLNTSDPTLVIPVQFWNTLEKVPVTFLKSPDGTEVSDVHPEKTLDIVVPLDLVMAPNASEAMEDMAVHFSNMLAQDDILVLSDVPNRVEGTDVSAVQPLKHLWKVTVLAEVWSLNSPEGMEVSEVHPLKASTNVLTP